MSIWLYPISERAGRVFVLEDGTKVPVSCTNFKDLVKKGKIREDAWWYVKTNFRNIRAGDEVYIYTGDDDIGVIGNAKIMDIEEEKGVWRINLTFDLRKCKKLIDQPVSAKVIRKWIPFPRAPVYNLTPFQIKLKKLLPF